MYVCACARVLRKAGGPVGTAAGSCDEPEIELPVYRRGAAAVNSWTVGGARFQVGAGMVPTPSFIATKLTWLNAIGTEGEQELALSFPKVEWCTGRL